MVQSQSPGEHYGDAFVKDVLRRRSFPPQVEEAALEHLERGETTEALQLLIKTHINGTETTD